jgi:hypothetical protein
MSLLIRRSDWFIGDLEHVIAYLINTMATEFNVHSPSLYPLYPFPANSSPQQAAGYPLPL